MALSKLWPSEVACNPSLLSSAIDHSIHVFKHDQLKPVQSETVQVVLHEQDILVSVPTGYDKLLIYQILPACTSYIDSEALPGEIPCISEP